MEKSSVCILVVLEYKNRKKLNNCVQDITRSVGWCASFSEHVFLFTDSDTKNLNLKCKNIRSTGNIESIFEYFADNRKPYDKCFFYFSGHGEEGELLDSHMIPYSCMELKKKVINLFPTSEFCFVFDCCNPGNMNLPYFLDGNRFIYKPTDADYTTQHIILILSNKQDEKSISTDTGSLFSVAFFNYLNNNKIKESDDPNKWIIDDGETRPTYSYCVPLEKNRNIRRLVGSVASNMRKQGAPSRQTVSVYSSHKMDPVLWLWIGNKEYTDFEIHEDSSLLIINK